MIQYFGFGNITASSTHVEGYFNDLKSRQFPYLPLSVDKFVINHTQILEGELF